MKNSIRLFLFSFIITVVSCTTDNDIKDNNVWKLEINNVAGKLSENLTPLQLDSTNHLVISGTINALDFKLINDSMPLLKILDLSNVSVVAYIANKQVDAYLDNSPARTIPKYAFYFNQTIEKIILPNSLKTVDSLAFANCKMLNDVTISVGLDSIKSNSFYSCSNLESIELPTQMKYIGDEAFSYCSILKTINIPDGVIYLGKYVFSFSTQLETIYLPYTLKYTQAETFYDCSGLINVDAENNVFSSLDGVLYNKSGKTLIQCPVSKTGVLVIPSTVQKIGNSAFLDCGLSTVEIPSSVTEIDYYAFSSSHLTSIHIPSTVKNLRGYVFNHCSNLSTVTIDEGITTISPYTFYFCFRLNSIIIPNTVDYISVHSFDNCTSLKSVFIPKSVNEINDYAFYHCDSLDLISTDRPVPLVLTTAKSVFYGVNKNSCILSVPTGSKSAYQNSGVWKDFKNIVESN